MDKKQYIRKQHNRDADPFFNSIFVIPTHLKLGLFKKIESKDLQIIHFFLSQCLLRLRSKHLHGLKKSWARRINLPTGYTCPSGYIICVLGYTTLLPAWVVKA